MKAASLVGNSLVSHRAQGGDVIASRLHMLLIQCVDCTKSLDQATFTCQSEVYSSVGTHMRHILDRARCLADGWALGEINYDNRQRLSLLESLMDASADAFMILADDISQFAGKEMEQPLQVKETICDDGTLMTSTSTLGRELLAIFNHTTHHLAIVKLILHYQGVTSLDDNFGKAPSTCCYEKEQA